MSSAPAEFRWELVDGGQVRWSSWHALAGSCFACCTCGYPGEHENGCGGREHGEAVDSPSGASLTHAEVCSAELVDALGDPVRSETRPAP